MKRALFLSFLQSVIRRKAPLEGRPIEDGEPPASPGLAGGLIRPEDLALLEKLRALIAKYGYRLNNFKIEITAPVSRGNAETAPARFSMELEIYRYRPVPSEGVSGVKAIARAAARRAGAEDRALIKKIRALAARRGYRSPDGGVNLYVQACQEEGEIVCLFSIKPVIYQPRDNPFNGG
jgi:hypothetical protein